jgi:hypothetical protein
MIVHHPTDSIHPDGVFCAHLEVPSLVENGYECFVSNIQLHRWRDELVHTFLSGLYCSTLLKETEGKGLFGWRGIPYKEVSKDVFFGYFCRIMPNPRFYWHITQVQAEEYIAKNWSTWVVKDEIIVKPGCYVASWLNRQELEYLLERYREVFNTTDEKPLRSCRGSKATIMRLEALIAMMDVFDKKSDGNRVSRFVYWYEF